MKKNSTEIEIPFGAKDSELYQFTYTIPDGYSAEIKDGKVIIKKKESEDERIKKEIIEFLTNGIWLEKKISEVRETRKYAEWIAYLEKQKDLTKEGVIKQLEEEFYACGTTPKWFHDTVQGAINHGRAEALGEIKAHEPVSTMEQKEQKPAEWSEEDEKMLNTTIETLKMEQECWKETGRCLNSDIQKCINFLKSALIFSNPSVLVEYGKWYAFSASSVDAISGSIGINYPGWSEGSTTN